MLLIAIFISVGLLSGVSAGLLGVGGGLVFMPIAKIYFIDYLQYPPSFLKVIIATSTVIIVANSLSATIQHKRKKNLDITMLPFFVGASLLGTKLGVSLVDTLPLTLTKSILATFLLVSAIRMLRGRDVNAEDKSLVAKDRLKIGGIAVGISTLASMLGLGGGAIMTPVLNIGFHQPIRKAIGTATMFTFTVSATASVFYLLQPSIDTPSHHSTIGYVDIEIASFVACGGIVGSWIGTKLLHSAPVETIQKVYAALLLAASIKMLF